MHSMHIFTNPSTNVGHKASIGVRNSHNQNNKRKKVYKFERYLKKT
jgi:hypothetical protein